MSSSWKMTVRRILDKLASRMAGVPRESLASLREIEYLWPGHANGVLSLLSKGAQNSDDEEASFRTAEALSTLVYPKYKFSEYGRLFLEDQAFIAHYQRFMDVDNWHSLDRKYTLDQLLQLVNGLDGDAAECGTCKGVSAYRLCLAFNSGDRLVHLFDSFEGLSEPEFCDGSYWSEGDMRTPESVLHSTLAEFSNYRVYPGWIPERFVEVSDHRFSFVHVDVDLYRPTLHSLEFFYNRLVAGGVMVMDDYGFRSCPGAKQATDEFFATKSEPIIKLPTGQAFIIKHASRT